MPYVPTDAVAFWTAVAAIASTVAVIVTAFSTYFVWQTLQSQNDPKVIVYVKHDANRPSLLVIVIENIGRDIAEDVKFTTSRQIPSEAWGVASPTTGPEKIMEDTAFIHGIPALGPGDPRVYTWGQYGGLSAALGENPVVVEYTYRRGSRKFTGRSCLEVKSFGRLDASEAPQAITAGAVTKIADETRRIGCSLEKLESVIAEQLSARSEQ